MVGYCGYGGLVYRWEKDDFSAITRRLRPIHLDGDGYREKSWKRKSGTNPFWSYSHPELRMEILLNYVLFVPLGLLLYLCFGEKFGLRVVLAGVLLSASIELIQLVFKIGVFEFDDMIGNTIGCLVGAVVGKTTKEIKKRIQTTPIDGVEER